MNIVFCAYAYKQKFQSGHNLQLDDKKDIYLKNSYVALRSCKYYNQETEVALVTNVELSAYWMELFTKSKIVVYRVDYDSFMFDEKYGWSLAFYKLCALKYICTLKFQNIVLIDTDTYIQRTFNDIWLECKNNILLYDISRGLYNGDYKKFCEEAQRFLDTKEYLTRWGGEFIAGNQRGLKQYIERCEKIYASMKDKNFITINGDEFIESVAAWIMKDQIKNAAAYVFRYWTGYHWHYVCSNYRSNPVCVIHCPREKDHGFIKLFNYITKHDDLPSPRIVHRLLNLDLLSYVKIELIKKIFGLKK